MTSNADEHDEDKKANQVIKTVFISLLIDLLGFTVILPLFPSLLEFYKSNDQGSLYSTMESAVTSFRKIIGVPESENINSVLFGGLIGSLFSFLQFLNSPLFGAASDRYGRKIMILVSLIGSAFAYALWGFSESFAVFLIARVIAGISEANVSITTALIADLPSSKARSKGMAIIGVAFSVGFVFGPMIGAWFAKIFSNHKYFYAGPAAFSFIITLIDIAYVAWFLPETLPPSKRATSLILSVSEFCHFLNPFALFKFSAVKSVRGTPKVYPLRRLGLVYFIYLFLFSGLEFTLTFLVHRRFSYSRMDQGKMFALLGLAMALIQGGYIRRKMDGKEKSLAIRGMAILVPGFFLIGNSTSPWQLYLGFACFAIAASSVVPCLSSLTASYGSVSEKGRVMGILRSLGGLARATGPLFASVSYWLFGATVTYTIGAIFLFIPVLLLKNLSVVEHKKTE